MSLPATSDNSKPPAKAISFPLLRLAPDAVIHGAELLLVGLVFFLLADRLFGLISKYAVNVFFSDQWEFNDATLFQKHSLWQMFAWQHGPHRQGLGALFARLVEPHFAWNSRTESFVVGGVIVAAAMCALYLKKRLYGRLSVFDVLIPAVFFIPAQYESLFVTANFAHGPFPLLLIMLYCLAWTCRRSVVKYPLILVINFFTIYTGFGLFLGFLTPILLLLDYRASAPEARLAKLYLAGAMVISLISLGSFFIGYRLNADLDCFSPQPQPLKQYAAYAALMFSNFFAVHGTGTFPLIVGSAALIALLAALATAAWQLLRRQNLTLPHAQQKRRLITVALIAYCLLFCASTAYGRLCGGLDTARASRYVIYLELGVLGVYFYLLNIRRSFTRRFLLAGLLAAVLFACSFIDPVEMGAFPNFKSHWKRCYFLTGNANLCSQIVGFPIYTHSAEGIHLREKLDYLRENRQNLFADSK